jgi:two-component system phosphate regulon response regulator OmpR
LTVCRKLRSAKDLTPVIMLTAKGEDMDRIMGLEVGCRRLSWQAIQPAETAGTHQRGVAPSPCADLLGRLPTRPGNCELWAFQFRSGCAHLRKDAQDLALTSGEFAMLKALVRHPRVALSREKLAQLARGRGFEPFDRSLDVQVSRLRKLIEVDATAPRYIQTVWGDRLRVCSGRSRLTL